MRPVALIVAVVVTLTGACAERLPTAPRPAAVEPGSARAGAEVPVVIRGTDFYLGVEVSYDDGSRTVVKSTFRAWLGEVELADVAYVDVATLTATVPAGLAPGGYDLTVVDPEGRTGTLAAAFAAVPCAGDDDCLDPCRSVHACQAGLCVMGPVDKDADGDGFLDAACPGGTDCDDDPAACGAGCAPGLPELCDGYDNDCDPATLDGSGEARLGQPCDGPDADQCLEGIWECVGAALVCSDTTDDSREGPYGDPSCSDGVDNDCDGLTDDEDPDCQPGMNTPPRPAILVTPGAGLPDTVFTASAVGTTDREDPPTALTYRWDWTADGTFEDTGVTAAHTYGVAGTYSVVLEVTDTGGLRAYATFTVVVSAATDLITVTTAVDESDSGATPTSPGGTGLSLREAIDYVISGGGNKTILVPSGMVINLTGNLLPKGVDGITIVGDGSIIDCTGIAGNAQCIQFQGNNHRYLGLELRNAPSIAIRGLGGSGARLERCYLHHNGAGLHFYTQSAGVVGPDNRVAFNGDYGILCNRACTIDGNRVHDNGGVGFSSGGAGAGCVVRQNFVYRNGNGIDAGVGGDQVVNNTIWANIGYGVSSAGGTLDCRNNIIANNGGWGIAGTSADFTFLDYNDLFGNASGACSACSGLGANSRADNPVFIDATADDLRLWPTSTMIDMGTDLGIDVNGPAPGSYNGVRPDIGAAEAP